MTRWRWKGAIGALVVTAFVVSCSSSNSVGTSGDASTLGEGGSPQGDAAKRDSGNAEAGPCSGADACGTGTGCKTGADCKSLVCKDGACEAPSPTDGVKNDSETDVDCGGGASPSTDGAEPCADGKTCSVGSDCTSTSCQAGKCVPPTCMDKIKDGMETDVDCGGPVCMGCPATDKCNLPRDCQSLVCTNGVCQAPTDTDHVQNDSETDVDCGGGLLANGTPPATERPSAQPARRASSVAIARKGSAPSALPARSTAASTPLQRTAAPRCRRASPQPTPTA